MDKYVVSIDGLVTALSAGNTVKVSPGIMEQEKLSLAGQDLPLLIAASQQIARGDFSQAIRLFRANTGAFSNPFVRASYSVTLVEAGYDLLRKGYPIKALPIFVEAQTEADKCEDKFEHARWNHEIDSYRFNARKNIGDCHIDIAEEHYAHNRGKSYIVSCEAGDEHFADAVTVWDKKLSRPQKELFTNTTIASVNNFGNLYVTWARSQFQRINPLGLTFADPKQREFLMLAGKFIRQGLSLRQISRQLQEVNRGVDEEMFRQNWQHFEEYAQEVYRHIMRAEAALK